MFRNLILTGGIGHDFADASAALRDILDEIGIASEITTDIEAGLAALGQGSFDLLTVYALRWSMLTSEKYAPHRARWGFSLSAAGRRALQAHLASGGGLLGLHTASICFDDWPEWRQMLGGAWVWGHSFHPPLGPVVARITPARHPITRDVEDFVLLEDEVYSDLSLMPDIEPLLVASPSANEIIKTPPSPALWAWRVAGGRVVYDALGHSRKSLEQPEHRRLLNNSALWAIGRLS